ncbi:RrF2 family transcriptional regulator [Lapidilactobacillus luobeiensis]|uniref:RrF2 family transcriptional regulator n=1 Tax=Lapidilactobacillus luobeiensis TaxID=2950371 RepID=UPI0021C36481|nr:Rrf2 family transcriptional regulator [Lapidilactobacillus luobeiensis]
MKIKRSVEQGIYVLLMLALQQDHRPLKSSVISQRLEVSDSYLKKILRKLVVADLIVSSASKDGGFALKRSIATISLLDVCEAIDQTDQLELPNLDLAARLFPGDRTHLAQSQEVATQAFQRAQAAFNAELGQLPLSRLLEKGSYQHGLIDWEQQH